MLPHSLSRLRLLAEPPPTLSPAPLCRLSLPLFLRTPCCRPPSGGGAYLYPSPCYGCSVREPLCPSCLPSVSVDRAARPCGRASAPSSLAATLAAARPRRVRVPRSGGSLALHAPAVGPPPGGHAWAGLSINNSKCAVVAHDFGTGRDMCTSHIRINGQALPQHDKHQTYKYLGMMVAVGGSWYGEKARVRRNIAECVRALKG